MNVNQEMFEFTLMQQLVIAAPIKILRRKTQKSNFVDFMRLMIFLVVN